MFTPKIHFQPSFTQPQVTQNLYDFLQNILSLCSTEERMFILLNTLKQIIKPK